MDEILTVLRAEWQAKHTSATAIVDNPASTPEQVAQAKGLFDARDALGAQIESRKAHLDQVVQLKGRGQAGDEWAGTPSRGLPFSKGRIEAGESEVDKLVPTGGFKSLGHFAHCCYKMGPDGRGERYAVESLKKWADVRQKWNEYHSKGGAILEEKTPSGLFEASDPDGGDLIPPQFSQQIYERMVASNLILEKLSPIPITGNTMTLNALKENSRVNGQRWGGTQGFWQGEADQYTKSKPQLRQINLKLQKLTVLTYATEELVQDSPQALEATLLKYAPLEINFKINDAVINGTGNGMPDGILKSNSLITVAAVSGQGANTFTYQNVLALYSRVVAGQRGSLVWLYGQDSEPQLFQLYLPTGTAAGVAVFKPNETGNGFSLMGRPAMVMEQCQALGTAGDVIAFATDGYACITKGGVQSFMSMHLRFDFGEYAFKWLFRFDGQAYDDVALTPFNGSNTVSSIAVLNSSRT